MCQRRSPRSTATVRRWLVSARRTRSSRSVVSGGSTDQPCHAPATSRRCSARTTWRGCSSMPLRL